jgi:DNA-binding NarL/FixJ family response regulator
MQMVSTKDERKPMGVVWVHCPSPVLALGLEKALEAEARVYHTEREIPASGSPSLVVFCPNGEDDDLLAAGVGRIKELASDAPVVVMGMRPELSLARAALQAKTSGFVHAGMPPEQIAHALALAKRGEVVIPRELLVEVVEEDRQEEEEGRTELTARQEEILELVDEGLSNQQIARRLFLSESTVKQHLRKVYQTLGVKNRNQAAGRFKRSKPVGMLGGMS